MMNFCRPATLDTAAGRYYTRLIAQGRKSVYTRFRTHSILSVPEFINEKRYHCTIKGTLNNALKGAHFFLLQALDGTRGYNTQNSFFHGLIIALGCGSSNYLNV